MDSSTLDSSFFMLTDDGSTLLSVRQTADGSLELLSTPVTILPNAEPPLQTPSSSSTDATNQIYSDTELNNIDQLHLPSNASLDLEPQDLSVLNKKQNVSVDIENSSLQNEHQTNSDSVIIQNLETTTTNIEPNNLIEQSLKNYHLKEARVRIEKLSIPPKKHARKKLGRPKNSTKTVKEPPCFKCDLCGQEFKKQYLLQKHLHEHAQDKPHQCPKCPATFNVPTNFTLHMATHKIGEPKCPECGRKFARIASLKTHLLVHEMDESLYCTECDDSFATQTQLEAHMSLHNEKWSSDEHRRCKLCRKQFTKPVLYRQHLRDHYKLQLKSTRQTRSGIQHLTSYKCKVCLKLFQKPSQLARHIRVHTGEKPYKCNICSRSFTQKNSVRMHMRQHSNVLPFSCTLCHAKFRHKYNLKDHENRVHRQSEEDKGRPMYRCSQCPCTYKNIKSLTYHIHYTHNKSNEQKTLNHDDENEAEEEEENAEEEEEERLSSNVNQEQAGPDTEEEELDLENNSPEQVDDGYVVMDAKKKTAIVTVLDKSKGKYIKLKQRLVKNSVFYDCTFCHKAFKKPSDLIRHLRCHTKEKPFKCKICERSFALKLTLETHQKTHAKEKEKRKGKEKEKETLGHIPCLMCKAVVSSEKVLATHIEKFHRCTICNKRYENLEEQTNHVSLHLQYLPEKDKDSAAKTKSKVPPEVESLASKIVLQEPLVIKESDNGQVHAQPSYRNNLARGKGRPHKCPSCPAAFMKVSHLTQHYRRHTGERPFSCRQCNRKFSSKSTLKAHFRIHEQSKPYLCPICDQKFASLSSMKRHQLRHSNKRGFMCPYCNKTFKSTNNCKKHMQGHKQEIAKQQLELQEKHQQPNKPIIISDQRITYQPITANLTLNLNDQVQDLNHIQKTNNSCFSTVPVTQNTQTLTQNIPVMNNSNKSSVKTLHADETGTITLPNYSDSQTLTSENIKELEETLNQQLLNLGVNFTMSNNVQQINEQSILSAETQEQPVLSIIYDNGTTLQSQVPLSAVTGTDNLNVLTTHLSSFDINQLMGNGMNMGIMQNSANNIIGVLTNTIPQNQSNPLPLVTNDFEFHSLTQQNKLNEVFEQSNYAITNDENKSIKQKKVKNKKEVNLQCHVCNKQKLSENDLKEHMKTHQERKKYECTHCSSKFCSTRGLSKHVKIHELQEKHKCYECNQEFPTSLQLREHIKDHVKKELKLKNPENADDVIKELESDNKNKNKKKNSTTNSCQYCTKVFRKPSDLVRHVRTHTGERPYQCHFCQKSFAVKCTLDSHLKIHSNEKSFHCHVCKNMFSTKSSLKTHMSIHTGILPFKCSMCDMKFRTSRLRKKHFLSHTKEPKSDLENQIENTPPSLQISEMQIMSGQTFSRICNEPQPVVVQQIIDQNHEQNLDQLTISGEISFNTDGTDGELLSLGEKNQLVANLQFLLANGLVTIQTEDPSTNQVSLATTGIMQSNYELPQEKSTEDTPHVFFNGDSLPDSTVQTTKTEERDNYMVLQLDSVDSTVQIRSNGETEEKAEQSPSGTRHECEECGKTFTRSSVLERHKRVHTGERPYKCNQCDKSFSQKSSLTMHQHSHTGSRPYPCAHCERSFTQNYNLQTHMRRVHKFEPAEARRLVKAMQFFNYDPKMPQTIVEEDKSLVGNSMPFVDLLK